VNYDEIDKNRLRLPANRNCYRLPRVSWALLKLLVFRRSEHNMPVLVGIPAQPGREYSLQNSVQSKCTSVPLDSRLKRHDVDRRRNSSRIPHHCKGTRSIL